MSDDNQEKKDEITLEAVEPIITQHSIKQGRKTLKYTATVGMMPLKDHDKDEIKANIFFTAYTLDDVKNTADRPLTIAFNGGPGSASIWLHIGALGPKRAEMTSEGFMPHPPFTLVDNKYTWLDKTDLLFIDPVGTGYSHSAEPEKNNENYWNMKGDFESVGEVIRLYLTRYGRWNSPLFLAGESYGTTRAAGLTDHLLGKGIALNGVMLISTILNFQTARFIRGNDTPYLVYTPTYAATAWYHGKLDDELQQKPLRDLMDEVEAWSEDVYAVALAKGDKLQGDERQKIVSDLARYTGLSEDYIERTNLRVNIMRFCKELLRDERRTVGRLDSRFKGIDADAAGEFFEFDPMLVEIDPPYVATFSQYMRHELGYETDRPYVSLSFDVNQKWEWDRGSFPDTSEALRKAMSKNTKMKVWAAQGYYDLGTPHFAWLYTKNHMSLEPELHENIHTTFYEAGHMMYLHEESLEQFKNDVDAFIDSATE